MRARIVQMKAVIDGENSSENEERAALKKMKRAEYMRAYYEANKNKLKAKRKKQPRTEATIASEQRYREKKRILKEIENMQAGPVFPRVE